GDPGCRHRDHLDAVHGRKVGEEVPDVRADAPVRRPLTQTAGINGNGGRAHQTMVTWSPMGARVLLVPHRLHDPLGTGIHRYAIELIRALAADESSADLDYAVSSIDEPDVAVGPPVVRIGGPRRLLHLRWAMLGRPPIEAFVG